MASLGTNEVLKTLRKWENTKSPCGMRYSSPSGIIFESAGDSCKVSGNVVELKRTGCLITITLQDDQEFEHYPPGATDSIEIDFVNLSPPPIEEAFKTAYSPNEFIALFKAGK
jgi:hypothetical protein